MKNMENMMHGKSESSPIELTDGTITLKPFTFSDVESHLAGDDEEQQKWISGGKSTVESVENWIKGNQESWKNNGPVFNFAIWSENNLSGMVEANRDAKKIKGLSDGDANISYATYPNARGKGYVSRAVNLMTEFLKTKGVKRAVIRVLPENKNSIRVPISCGFIETGFVDTDEGKMIVYTKELN